MDWFTGHLHTPMPQKHANHKHTHSLSLSVIFLSRRSLVVFLSSSLSSPSFISIRICCFCCRSLSLSLSVHPRSLLPLCRSLRLSISISLFSALVISRAFSMLSLSSTSFCHSLILSPSLKGTGNCNYDSPAAATV